MKKIFIYCFVWAALFYSCKKQDFKYETGSLTIINAVVGSNPFVTNFSGDYWLPNYYKNALQVSYGTWNSSYQFSFDSRIQWLRLYQFPDTTDKSVAYYDLELDVPIGSMRTLFLTGNITNHDTLVLDDNPPYHAPSDSSFGVRVINLSPGSSPVNVTISNNPSMAEFSDIPYKGYSEYKNYPASASSSSSLSFQFRDANTGTILATQVFTGLNNPGTNSTTNNYRFRNFTLALIGEPGGTGNAAQKAFIINNF